MSIWEKRECDILPGWRISQALGPYKLFLLPCLLDLCSSLSFLSILQQLGISLMLVVKILSVPVWTQWPEDELLRMYFFKERLVPVRITGVDPL